MSNAITIPLPTEVLEVIVAEAKTSVLEELAARGDASWPEWMSVETVARYLDVPEERVRKLKDRGAIPYYQDGPGCRVFFRRRELDEWMSGFRQAARGGVA
jgi:excisionase family DNA binding protein